MVRVDRSAWNHNVRAIARTYGASYGMGLTLREIELTAVTDINAASGLVLASVLLLGMGMSFGAVTGEVLVSLLPRALRLFSDERVQTMQNFMASQERGHLWLRLVSFSLFLGVACALGRMEGADSYATFGRTTVLCTAICLGGLATRSDLSAQLWHA
jgi:hypothetical protein